MSLRKYLDVPKHIERLNTEVGELCERVAKLEVEVKWVKWLTMLIVGGIIALVAKAYWPVP